METEIFAKMEALLYVSGDEGITLTELAEQLMIDKQLTQSGLTQLTKRYKANEAGALMVTHSADTYRLTTKPQYANLVTSFLDQARPTELSHASLEVMAIVFYKQPVTRIEIDELRGVNSAAVIKRLVSQNLLVVSGVKKEVGNPKEYSVTNFGMDYFGLQSLDELPKANPEPLDATDSEDLIQRFNQSLND